MILAELVVMITLFFGYVAILASFYAIIAALETAKTLEKTRKQYFTKMATQLGDRGSLFALLDEIEDHNPRLLFSPNYAFWPIGVSLIYCTIPLLALITHSVLSNFVPVFFPIAYFKEIFTIAFYVALCYSLARAVFAYQYYGNYNKLGKKFVDDESVEQILDIEYSLKMGINSAQAVNHDEEQSTGRDEAFSNGI